jgi:hypothetical protein
MKVPTSRVTVDPTIQIREHLSEDAIERYSEMSTEPPPVVVFGPTNILGDGFHRYEVARRKGQPTIAADRREGGRDEAMEYAAIANLTNSEPLTRVERNAAVRRLMDLHPEWTQERVAAATGVARTTIVNIDNARSLRDALPAEVLEATNGDGPALTDTHLYRIAVLPKEQREPVARQAAEEHWSEPETRRHVAEVKAGLPISETLRLTKPASAPVQAVIAAALAFFDTEITWNGRALTYREVIETVAQNRDALELRDPLAPTASLTRELFDALNTLEWEAHRLVAPFALTAGAA